MPEENWGGQGLLGCDVVQGAFHGIPTRRQNLWGDKHEDLAPNVRMKGAFNLEEIESKEVNYETNLDPVEDSEIKIKQTFSSGSSPSSPKSNSSSKSFDSRIKELENEQKNIVEPNFEKEEKDEENEKDEEKFENQEIQVKQDIQV